MKQTLTSNMITLINMNQTTILALSMPVVSMLNAIGLR